MSPCPLLKNCGVYSFCGKKSQDVASGCQSCARGWPHTGVRDYNKKEAMNLGARGKNCGVNMIKIHCLKFLKN